MEVHHHAHHGGKKNWKSYIWEFLMLFLAVFCGFLAEYQLEHKIEKDREKQYIESMIADLQEDTAKIHYIVAVCSIQVKAFDSLLSNIYHTPYTDSSLRMMYYLQRRYTATKNTVFFTKRTITQLRNSGGLRLIRNKQASDSIVVYNEATEQAEKQGYTFSDDRLGKVNNVAIQLFDVKYVLNYNRNTVANLLTANTPIALLRNDEQLLKEYANTIYYANGTLSGYITMIKEIEKKAINTISFLRKEYHLE